MNVKEIMNSNPITVNSNTPLNEISNIFNRTNIWSIYIFENGKLVGIVTRNDLKQRGKGKSKNTPVSKIMSANVHTIDCNADVKQAIVKLDRFRINGLAVTENGHLCGVVTRYDIRKRYYPHIKTDSNHTENGYNVSNSYSFNQIKKKVSQWKNEGYNLSFALK